MIKKALILAALLPFLAAAKCTADPEVIIRMQYVLPDIPAALFVCNHVPVSAFPEPATMTDEQLIRLIKTYEEHLNTCVSNMKGIKKYIASAKAELEKKQANR